MKKSFFMAALLRSTAFDNEAGWKLDASGKVETKDGNPIWVDANGGESTMQGDTITRLNSDARTLRKRAETAEAIARNFEGIDHEKAKKAIELVEKIDAKTLIDAGKVDEVKKQITEQFSAQIAEKDKAFSDLQTRYDNATISNIFANSDFIKKNVVVPSDMFEAKFRGNVKIKDGQTEFYYDDGTQVGSKKHIGQNADPDEAFELLVSKHPQRDQILKASDSNGSGNNGNGGNRGGNGRTMRRSDYEALNPVAKADAGVRMSKGELKIVD